MFPSYDIAPVRSRLPRRQHGSSFPACWLQLTGAKAAVLVVTPIFLRELEKHKAFHARRQIKDRAGATVQWLAPFIRGENVSEIRSGVTLSFVPKEPILDYVAHDLDRALADDVLIANVLTYDAIDLSLVRVATADIGLELKLRSRGLAPLVLPDELRLAQETDPVQQELEKTRRELAQLKGRQPRLTLSFAENDTQNNLEISLRHLSDYTMQEALEEVMRKYPAVPVRQPKSADPTSASADGISRLLNSLNALADAGAVLVNPLMNPERAEAYNEELRRYYQRHAQYLVKFRDWAENDARTFEIALWLSNTGSAMATDIDLTLLFPEGMEVMKVNDRPPEPEIPSPPQVPTLFDLSTHDDVETTPIWEPLEPLDFVSLDSSGKPSVDAEHRSVSFSVSSLKHHNHFRLDPFLARFVTQDVVASFSVDYSIAAIELPSPHEGKLHFVVAKQTAT
jgi:hypothetical protein